MKKILIVVCCVLGLLCALYGVSQDNAVELIASNVNKLSTTLTKLSDYLLPGEFSSEFIQNTDWLKIEVSGIVPQEYLSGLGYNENTDQMFNNSFRVDNILAIGFEDVKNTRFIKMTRNVNGETKIVYMCRDGDFSISGNDCNAFSIDGLWIYGYVSRREVFYDDPSIRTVGVVFISETDETIEHMVTQTWID